MTPMLDPGHIWNVIYNARSNKCHPPTSPNTAPATQNDSHAWSSSHTKRHLQCAEQQVSPSNLTKYCACHTEWLACLIVVTYETSFTMRGATSVTLQPHQILRLPHRMTRMLDRCHIWNVIYNARSNRCHHPTSPNTAPATQNDSTALSSSHMKRHLQCAEQQVSLSNLTKYCACHEKWHCKISEKISKNRWNVISNAGTIREWSDHDPRMIREWSDHENANRNPPRNRGYFSNSPRAFSIVKYNVSSPILHSNIHHVLRLPQKVTLDLHQILPLPRKVTLELHQILPLPRKVTLQLHQVLHLPRKVTLDLHQVLHLPQKVTRIVHPRDIWNLIYNARSNQCHPPNSPNTAPATQNDHLTSGRNLRKTGDRNVISNAGTIRGWSDHDPRMIRPWKRKPQRASQVRLLFELPRSIFYCKIQRFEPNLTFKHSPSAAPATKSNTWPSPNTAPTTKSNTWTSPNTLSIAEWLQSRFWSSELLIWKVNLGIKISINIFFMQNLDRILIEILIGNIDWKLIENIDLLLKGSWLALDLLLIWSWFAVYVFILKTSAWNLHFMAQKL